MFTYSKGLPSNPVASILSRSLLSAVRERFALDWHGIHGAPHWARVRVNGLAIAAQTGARTDVIELFAFLHDSCRENDGHDPAHGPRAVDFSASLRGVLFDIDDAGFVLLAEACSAHSDGRMMAHPTVQACWDADRLELWRVWITPDPRRLATQTARGRHLFREAKRRSLFWRERRARFHREREVEEDQPMTTGRP